MEDMKHVDLFSGIGGFALAVDTVWPGSEHIFCDNDPFCQAVLKKHWPNSKIYGDIRSVSKKQFVADSRSEESDGLPKFTREKSTETWDIDILTGGFPCQPFSQAGRRKGTDDDRYLWPEMLRVIRELSPVWVIAENVRGLLTWNDGMVFEQVCSDLEGEGYEVQAFVIPAVSVNAPHRRDRVWFVAHTTSKRGGTELDHLSREDGRPPEQPPESWGTNTHTPHARRDRWSTRPSESMEPTSQEPEWKNYRNSNWDATWLEVATRLCTVDDGLRYDVVRPDGRRDAETKPRPKGWRNAALKGAGNAIVPQVAEIIIRSFTINSTNV